MSEGEAEACTSQDIGKTSETCSVGVETKDEPSEELIAISNSSAAQLDENKQVSEECENYIQNLSASSSNPLISPTAKSKRRSKHRSGRNRKRKWKPYTKLSWLERKKVEERDARRAQRVRDEMSACGLALAPYNTTQFLMNDHEIEEPDYDHVHNGHIHRDHHSGESSDEYSMCSDDEDYINQQFMADYETFQDQYLDSLTQEELVEQVVDLEEKVEALQNKLNEVRHERIRRGIEILDPEAEMQKIQVFREEIRKIALENEELERRNMELEKAMLENSKDSLSTSDQN